MLEGGDRAWKRGNVEFWLCFLVWFVHDTLGADFGRMEDCDAEDWNRQFTTSHRGCHEMKNLAHRIDRSQEYSHNAMYGVFFTFRVIFNGIYNREQSLERTNPQRGSLARQNAKFGFVWSVVHTRCRYIP